MHTSVSHKAQIKASDFKALVDAVSKFPSIGGFSDSDTVNIAVADGVASVSIVGGVVSSFASIEATGMLPVIGLNDKLINGFANLCAGDSLVTIEVANKEIILRCKHERAVQPFKKGVIHLPPDGATVEGVVKLPVTENIAAQMAYLASFAFGDQVQPELYCVYVHPSGHMLSFALSVGGVVKVAIKSKTGSAIPLPIAKELQKGDVLYAGTRQTVVQSGKSCYTMPTPVEASAKFPAQMLLNFGKIPRNVIVECSEAALADAARKFSVCLGSLSRDEIVVRATIKDGRFELFAENAGVRYSTSVRGAVCLVDAVFYLPLNDLSKVMETSGTDAQMTIAIGKANREVFLVFEHSWIVFAAHQANS